MNPPPEVQQWLTEHDLAVVTTAEAEHLAKRARTCIICQALAADPTEDQLHRLVRIYEQQIGAQANRLIDLDNLDKLTLKEQVEEQARTIERLNLILENTRRPA